MNIDTLTMYTNTYYVYERYLHVCRLFIYSFLVIIKFNYRLSIYLVKVRNKVNMHAIVHAETSLDIAAQNLTSLHNGWMLI